MGYAPVNGIDIYYETFEDESGWPLLLVCGLGMQLISWNITAASGGAAAVSA
jgi:hypothetical protein